jgi:hypothetical protein
MSNLQPSTQVKMKLIEYIKNLFRVERSDLEKERSKLINKMRKLYKFLEKDFGYIYTIEKEVDKYPGGPKYYINKYTNIKAQRQIEVTLYRNSTPLYFYLKRLHNNIEPSYSDNNNCFDFFDIDIYNGIDNHDRHHPYLPPDYEFANVKVGLEILKSIPNILNGVEWFDRNRLDKIYFETRGYKSGRSDDATFALIKKTFSFLEADYNFKIVYDYDKLRPFEQELGGHLVYSNGKITIGFSVDFRDHNFTAYLLDTKDYNFDNFWQIGECIGKGETTENEFILLQSEIETRIKNYYR